MRVTIVGPERSRLVRAIQIRRQADDRARPKGLHLSTITDDYCKMAWPEEYRMSLTEASAAGFQEIGNAWEDLVVHALSARFKRDWVKPEPRQFRGIWCSPDGEQQSSRTIHEVKACWKSRRDFVAVDDDGRVIHKSPKWLSYEIRILGYLKAWGWTRAKLHVWFVNGDYPRGGPIPEWPITYIIQEKQKAIDRNWRNLMQHADDRRLRRLT